MDSRVPGHSNGKTSGFNTCIQSLLQFSIQHHRVAMPKRFVSIWFRYLLTDWKTIRQPSLKEVPVVFVRPDHGRMLICALNIHAEQAGLRNGMTAADAKVL